MLLTQDQKMIRDAVRAFAQEELWPHAAQWDRDHTFPRQAHKGLAALGCYGICVPEEYGGAGLDYLTLSLVLEEIAAQDMRFLVHGEVTDPAIDIFDREAAFIERILLPVLDKVPCLKTVFEHITTAEAARLVCQSGDNLAASVTPQHLLLNRNDLLVGGVHPHHYCLPVLKRESHRQALLEAVSGAQAHKFFLGTDSAPHPQHAKENACGCAGMFSAATAIELYAEAFEQIGALDKLEAFASKNGARFYGLPENTDTITLVKQAQTVPNSFPIGNGGNLVPMRAGGSVAWTMQS